MRREEQKLDNPAWYSLSENHQDFSVNYDGIKFYHPDYCPFGGFTDLDKTLTGIDQYSALANNFYIVGDQPAISHNLNINKELICNQMVLHAPIEMELNIEITELQESHQADLLALVNLVQPGYFKEKTPKMGSYYGIYSHHQLIAVTGERLKMNNYTEISAVVTHPQHTGKGYAKQLVAHACKKVFSEDKIPFLHVTESNASAINLYHKLGFVHRRKISLWNLIVKS